MQICAALSLIDVSLSEPDDVTYAGHAAAGLVRKLIATAGANANSDDTVFAGGIFAFAAASHFSSLIGASFEQSSSLALLELSHGSPEEFQRTFDSVIAAYNQMSSNGSKVIPTIKQSVASWTYSPTSGQLEKLTELFKQCLREATKVEDDGAPHLRVVQANLISPR